MLHLVRHGRTAANAEQRLLGRLDPPLDDEGRRQAGAVADHLAARLAGAGARVAVVSSPLLRTRQTAEVIVSALGDRAGAVEVDERWVELDYGELDGTPLAEVPTEMWVQWRSDPGFRPPGGETLVEVDRRVADALEALTTRLHPTTGEDVTSDVVVVSHVSPIKAAVSWVLGVPGELPWRLFLAPGSLSVASLAPGRTILHSFNEQPAPGRATAPSS